MIKNLEWVWCIARDNNGIVGWHLEIGAWYYGGTLCLELLIGALSISVGDWHE